MTFKRRVWLAVFLLPCLLIAEEKKKEEEDQKPQRIQKEDSVTIDGKKINYRVTASTLTLKSEKDKDRASIFHIVYERIGIPNRNKRPVVFCFNGGPGSSAVWLHLGGVGPRLVPTTTDGTKTLPPPRELEANPHSILDVADLVFIDPVSTGYSRPEGETKKSEFHGVTEDVQSVGDFIRRWVSENDRWASPKFLLGESYGGVRAAGLSEHLQSRYGMTLNGTILLSSLLDFRTLRSGHGDDIPESVFLPAYTAVAHHHGKIQGDRDQLYQQARDFAFGDYAVTLLKGSNITAEERHRTAQKLAALTGINADIWQKSKLRLSPSRFRKELLRDQGLVLGRFDARVAWPVTDAASQHSSYDPSYAVVYGAFSTAMNHYLSDELDWEGHHPYEILTRKVHPWNWGSGNQITNVSGKLVTAMRNNPDLRVLVMCGYSDLATPPTGILHSIDHLHQLPDARRESIEVTWYEAGHMFYLNQPDLEKMRQDLVAFITAK